MRDQLNWIGAGPCGREERHVVAPLRQALDQFERYQLGTAVITRGSGHERRGNHGVAHKALVLQCNQVTAGTALPVCGISHRHRASADMIADARRWSLETWHKS